MMNKRDYDVILALAQAPMTSQRELAHRCGISLGASNKSLQNLRKQGYLDEAGTLTDRAMELLERSRPRRAVILAAGFGVRMVPINLEIPKGLLEVRGEVLIERLIRQLHQAGIRDIRIVVGFMKERFEYLIDQFGVKLVINPQYSRKNNLHSLALTKEFLENAYIVPCDLWCGENPFRSRELYSWYLVGSETVPESMVRVNRKGELVRSDCGGNQMLGISYLTGPTAQTVSRRLGEMASSPRYDDSFWEDSAFAGERMLPWARVSLPETVVEINTYEQLRDLDGESDHLRTDAISTVARVFGVEENEVRDIQVLKKGMTNRSFLFTCRGKKYIMRIPGEGTDKLINRKQEAAVYGVLAGRAICDDVAYLNPENGYKITEFLEGARVCDPENSEDIRRCMEKLRAFHEARLTVAHEFDLFAQLEYYESLWQGAPSEYRDYGSTKRKVLSLRQYIDAQEKERTLTHIDAVPDNFLFLNDGTVRLIDWEYAGMQDPHVDIAMFCVYAMYDREKVERLIDAYFPEGCKPHVRVKLYCYIALCGLLWSNWCEYKRQLGVEFGEYSLAQYRFAKEYYRLAREGISRLEEEEGKNHA